MPPEGERRAPPHRRLPYCLDLVLDVLLEALPAHAHHHAVLLGDRRVSGFRLEPHHPATPE